MSALQPKGNTSDVTVNFLVYDVSSSNVFHIIVLTVFLLIFQKLESRVQSDTDLKLSDTLRYYMRDSKAALDLMYRRSRCLADFDTANKNLDRARTKNKEVQQAETAQENIKKKFESISEKAKDGKDQFCF
jgi:hypothetical protein